MPRCRWVPDKEVGRFWLPECFGGIYGPAGCYCPREPKADRITALEKRIAKLEKIVNQQLKREG